MRKKILPLLTGPDSHKPGFTAYALEALRNGVPVFNLGHDLLEDDDDILTGLIINQADGVVYPVSQGVAVLLSFEDADPVFQVPLLNSMMQKCPGDYHAPIQQTVRKLQQQRDSDDGTWNRDEMRYYDKEAETDEKRNKMAETIRNVPVHRILVPRKKHITDLLSGMVQKGNILETGCGNSNTVFNVWNPRQHHFHYIGTDISFKRLLVARQLIPEGDFLQASALNLPFREESFDAIVSFGMLHHLPRPEEAVAGMTPLVKRGGYFAFHEPIEKPVFRFKGMQRLKKMMSTYQHSAHDGKINLKSVKERLTLDGFTTIQQTDQISPVRSVTETVIKKINRKIMLRKPVIEFLERTDQIILKTIGKLSSRTGPNAVLAVLRKNGK